MPPWARDFGGASFIFNFRVAMMGKYGSRKFWVHAVCMAVMSLLPIAYAHFQVATEVQMLVLGCIASTALGYNIANVVDKRLNGKDE